ncbi:hypothetical protein SBA5_180036 [Candidatus Sulfotelmatomonas gaucii]|uniref:Uncharacterized protein n=1 Tax=Candidatus Sulfuritelmatomonas gaucii TaxID=2043161 RepID=A0A2N9L790_9BACT|nr:hypothetical protein SBA5_180036 [Candidatus Sulfotelmatomonas gaucii]
MIPLAARLSKSRSFCNIIAATQMKPI